MDALDERIKLIEHSRLIGVIVETAKEKLAARKPPKGLKESIFIIDRRDEAVGVAKHISHRSEFGGDDGQPEEHRFKDDKGLAFME